VIDGDTAVVRIDDGRVEHVRYIGIDTPESTPNQPLQCFGHEAAAANERLVDGARIRLVPGAEPRDVYGRLLAYVHVGRVFVNARLVKRGFARSLTIPPNDAHAPLFQRLEAAAGRRAIGLWRSCSG
jgi:micrococcal nuclease